MQPFNLMRMCVIRQRQHIFCGPVIEKQLEEEDMSALYKDIEMPVVFDLCRMEQTGIAVQKEALKSYGEDLLEKLNHFSLKFMHLQEKSLTFFLQNSLEKCCLRI